MAPTDPSAGVPGPDPMAAIGGLDSARREGPTEGPRNAGMRVLVGGTGMVRLPAPTGGAIEAYIHDILGMFAPPGPEPGPWSVTAASDWAPGYEFAGQCRPVHSPIDRYPLPPYLSALAHSVGGVLTAVALVREMRRHRPDVLHLNEELSIYLCQRLSVPKVLTVHSPAEFLLHLAEREVPSHGRGRTDGAVNSLLRRLDWSVVRDALSSYDGVIVLTSFAQEMLRRLGTESTLIPLPVDTDRFSPRTDGSAGSARTVLFVGRLERRKNPTILVPALARLPEDVRLVLIGRGPEEPAIRAMARRLGVQRRVSIVPECSPSELAQWYQTSRVLALPSYLEAYGKVVSEALASGLPVVVARSHAFDDLTRAHVATTFQTADECTAVLETLLAEDGERARRSARSREFAVTHLSYAAVRQRLAGVYRSAVGA